MDRYEDDIIAWLWRVFIETKGADPFILPYLPMTKVINIIFHLIHIYIYICFKVSILCNRGNITLSS